MDLSQDLSLIKERAEKRNNHNLIYFRKCPHSSCTDTYNGGGGGGGEARSLKEGLKKEVGRDPSLLLWDTNRISL